MAVLVSVEVREGVAVVCRRADGADAARLRRCAERLAAASHRGVERVVAAGAAGDGWELVTEHAGQPVGAARMGTAARLAAVGASAAAALADLHHRGLVHGRLDGTRVLVGPQGGAVLCGLGPDAGEATPADDVAALGSVLLAVLAELDEVGQGRLEAALAATALPPARRPSARRLAADLAALAAPRSRTRRPFRPRMGRKVDGFAEVGRPPRLRGRLALASLAVLVVVLALGLRLRSVAEPTGEPAPAPPASSTTLPVEPPSSPPDLRCVAVVGREVDESACGFAALVEQDGAVVVDGVRSVLGRAGDEVAVADWDCDGAPEPALLRPGSGELLVFGPADVQGARAVVRAERVPGAEVLAPSQGSGGCAELGVAGGGGERLAIDG